MKNQTFSALVALCAFAVPGTALAQDADYGDQGERSSGRSNGNVQVGPYIEASQIVVAELSPGDDVVTYTQLAAGVDVSITGRNNGGSVSLRYERNIGYGDDAFDSDTVSGIARGYVSVVPNALTFEAGALASRTGVDANGGASLNSLNSVDAENQVYSAYAGPNLHTSAGDVQINANYRIGYTKVESNSTAVTVDGLSPVDVFDDSLSQAASFHVGTAPGQPLPVGLGVGGGVAQEDISNLDQRVRDAYIRGDVTVPVTQSLAVVGGIGYEDVEISGRDALFDVDGNPVIGDDGRLVTDTSGPRQIAYEADGLIWDVGVVWRPSSRTSLNATVGRRYDSTSYYGSFDWAPNSRSTVNVSVYDAIAGFGSQLNNALANLPTEFTASRNALTGDLIGCVGGEEGANCLTGILGSVRSATYRSRGVAASYATTLGRLQTGVAAGYDRRKFIAAPGTILAAANGVVDENYWVTYYLNGELGANAGFSANTYANWLKSGFDSTGDVLGVGASASYRRRIISGLSARAAVAVDHFENSLSEDDLTAASALVGLRYDF